MTSRFGTSRARLSALALVLAIGVPTLTGCATSPIPPPIVSKAALGEIIIYRNGVAYFERHLPPQEHELTLRVPAERVDDFLKSLTVIDVKTGETMPVSYPTMDRQGGDVQMTIKLPDKHNGLRISYVTESPAWKPSYRLVLDEKGKGSLQGWAVVDNVSGEDWKHVKIGVGSTSALSFRYDLASVRQVDRVTLSSGSLLAVAPPTGGSPFAAKDKPRVMANLDQSVVDELSEDGDETREDDAKKVVTLDSFSIEGRVSKPADLQSGLAGVGHGRGAGGGGKVAGGFRTPAHRPRPKSTPQPEPEPEEARPVFGANTKMPSQQARGQSLVAQLSRQLQGTNETIRIEGYAKSGDKDARMTSLDNANRVREELIRNGIPASQIEAVGTGEIDEDQAVRVVAVNERSEAHSGKKGEDGKSQLDAVLEGQPLGQAHFVSAEPMSIEVNHSAMVSILNETTDAQRVYFYDPISERGSKSFAFNAIKLVNPSKYTLDSGPFTVYAKGEFLGEGLAEAILPHSTAFIPFALDRTIIVEPEVTGREEIDRLVTIQRGIVTTESRHIRSTKLAITNRGKQDSIVYVRHQVAPEYELSPSKLKVEKLGGAHLFPVTVKAGDSLELVIEEHKPIERTVNINSESGVKAIAVYLRKAKLDKELSESLRQIVERHEQSADIEKRIQLLMDQMGVYRQRVDEINVQLVTLRKVTQAAKLRRHLSDKMEEISNKLQDATMEVTDLKAHLMTVRIELSDKLAELTLKQEEKTAKLDTPKPEGTP